MKFPAAVHRHVGLCSALSRLPRENRIAARLARNFGLVSNKDSKSAREASASRQIVIECPESDSAAMTALSPISVQKSRWRSEKSLSVKQRLRDGTQINQLQSEEPVRQRDPVIRFLDTL
jgi:hypothetical protein